MHPRAFVVIDIQNDYFPSGAMALHDPDAAAEHAHRALTHARNNGVSCIVVQHINERPGATFFRPGTQGVAMHPDFLPRADETHLIKHYPNAFRETALDQELKRLGVEELVIVGMMTHMCIDTTVRAAADRAYRVTVLSDATATRDLRFGDATVPANMVQAAYLAALNGSFARVMTATQWIDEA